MKWRPINLSGLLVTAANSVILIEEVFVAKIISGPHKSSSFLKISFLIALFSVAASITKSTSFIRFISPEVVILVNADCFCSSVSLPLL